MTRALVALWFFFAGLGGAVFLAAILYLGGSPVPPDIYGPWVYFIPGWVWAAGQMVAGWTGATGILLRSRALTLIGGGALTLDMAFLAGAGLLAGPKGSVLAINALAWIGPYSFAAMVIVLMVRGGADE